MAADCTARGPGVDLHGCDLVGADLTDADLTGADLTGANLTEATLTFVNLTGADLTNANLTGATIGVLIVDRIEGSPIWSNTTCPNGVVQSTQCPRTSAG